MKKNKLYNNDPCSSNSASSGSLENNIIEDYIDSETSRRSLDTLD
jgi:hypothetical protein